MKDSKLCSVITALTLLSAASSALASTGSINFVGNVANASCTVSELTSNVNFSPVSRAYAQSLGHGTPIEAKPVTISVTGCPANVSKANLTVDFNEGNRYGGIVPEANSDAKGIAVTLRNQDNNTLIRKGAVISNDLSGGATDFTIINQLTRSVRTDEGGDQNVVSGNYAALVNLTMSYE